MQLKVPTLEGGLTETETADGLPNAAVPVMKELLLTPLTRHQSKLVWARQLNVVPLLTALLMVRACAAGAAPPETTGPNEKEGGFNPMRGLAAAGQVPVDGACA